MKFENLYRRDSNKLKQIVKFDGVRKVGWRSPSNIALIKYWGKRDFQLPQNPSLSFALSKSFTETTIQYYFKSKNGISLDFTFEGNKNELFEKRINGYLNSILDFFPFLNFLHLKIESKNSFPHSSGIASSASAMSALALCLVSIENNLFGTLKNKKSFFKKASFIARLGSGSAARSVYGGYSVWGKHPNILGSDDELAIPFGIEVHPKFQNLQNAILITSSESKKVSSSKGHQLMEGHSYANARYEQAGNNLTSIVKALQSGDEENFIKIVENEALSLHALMMASKKGFTLLNENTWRIINWIRCYREEKNVFLTFTLDAGPNVHVVYKQADKSKIEKALRSDLIRFCENDKWIDDQLGSGPSLIT